MAKREGTGANRVNGEGNLCSLLLNSERDGDTDFVFLARDTVSPYLDTRTLKAAGKPEIREYKAVFIVNDEEIGHELVVNCAP